VADVGRIPEETIQEIRDRVDIVGLIGRAVTLKKAGRTFKGLCPFHQEKTPSFTVSAERGTFHCFGCGEGGNAFAFLMRHENLTFPEVARALAAEVGIEIPETGRRERGASEEALRAIAVAQALYRRSLAGPEGAEARAYLERRGLDAAAIERFGLGLAPDRWDAVASALAAERIPAEVGERAGLLKPRERGGHYDLLRGRITFPIQDVHGRVVAFGGRALGEAQEPKYLNTPETCVFRKREAFYGMPFALEPMRSQDRAVIVEGYFDWIALQRAGIGEALATCGTSVTEEHARGLRRRTRYVVLLFDGDEAGQRAVVRALLVLLPQGLRVLAAALPSGQDPDDFLRSEGTEALRALVDGARPALELVIGRAVAGGVATPWERADAVVEVIPLLLAIADPVERGEFARRLALATGTAAADVEAALRRAARGEPPEPAPAPARRASRSEEHFARALALLLEHPLLAEGAREAALPELAPDEAWAALAAMLLDAALLAAVAEASVDVAALADRVSGEACRRLLALAASPLPLPADPERARAALQDTLAWLRRRSERAAARSLTVKIGEAPADAALLLEKQRQLERRRLARGIPSGLGRSELA
jgi:DNA primase